MALTGFARQYWQKTLEGFSVASPLVVEKGETEKAIGSSRDYESEQLKLTNRQTEEVGAFITRTELSTTVLLHGIWASLFYRYGAGEEIVYGCTDDVMTGTGVPMRVKVVPHVSASTWLNELQSHVETARQFFGTPLDAIHKLSGFADDMPLFKSALDLSKKAFDDNEFRRIGCPLVFKPDMQSEKSVLTIHFDPSCFDLGTIKRILGHIEMPLSGILGNEQACVANVAMLTTAEFNHIVYSWNRTQTDYPNATCLHQLFEERVEQDPDAVALIFGDQHLTYAGLNQQANQLAHHLISLGIGPDRLVVEVLRPERSLSHNPIYQFMFVLQNAPLPSYEFSGISVSSQEIDSGIALFDLTLNMWEEENGLNGYFESNTDLFDAGSIDRMVGHFETLLQGVANSPDQDISQFQLLKKDEREQLLHGWNDTATNFPEQLCIHEVFEEKAKSSPSAIAVSCPGGECLTYEDLNARANQLSHCLLSQGVQRNEFVGICVERSLEMIVGILGIIKAGAAYAPIDPKYPSDRIAYMLKDTGTRIVLSQARLVDSLPLSGLKILRLDSDWRDISKYGSANANAAVSADDLVYIIYTSGSTGIPKGVPITHRNLVHSTYARFKVYPEAVTGFVLLSSFAFDSSVAGLFWTLCQGGALTLPEFGAEQDIDLILENVEASQASHLLTLPSLYSLLLDEAKDGQLASLKTAIVAGEVCPTELIGHHHDVLPNVALYNEYGPTEGTVWSTVYETKQDCPHSRVPIGRPIPNMQVFILDRYWFNQLQLSQPAFWNQSFLFEVPADLDPDVFQEAINIIVGHHDALRMRFCFNASNMTQFNLEELEDLSLARYDLAECSDDERERELERLMYRHHAMLDPEKAKNGQFAYFDFGAQTAGRVFISVHHLVIDAVSWTIIREDLETVYYQLQSNQPLQLAMKTTSFKEWAQSLVKYARSESLRDEIDYWLEPARTGNNRVPLDFENGDNSESSTCVKTVCLGYEETSQLLQEVPSVYNTEIDDILLTALLHAFSNWTGEHTLVLEKEGHGREDIIEGIDLTRTVGWFTSVYQLILHVEDLSDCGRSIKIIKEQIRAIPNHGIGNDILRYLSPDESVRQAIEALPKADVLFNYLGQRDNRQSKDRLLKMTGESTGPEHHPDNLRHHVIEINSIVFEGQLRTDFCYSKNLHKASTIEALAKTYNDHLENIIQHCLSATVGGFTPSDFPEAGLDQVDLDDILFELSE